MIQYRTAFIIFALHPSVSLSIVYTIFQLIERQTKYIPCLHPRNLHLYPSDWGVNVRIYLSWITVSARSERGLESESNYCPSIYQLSIHPRTWIYSISTHRFALVLFSSSRSVCSADNVRMIYPAIVYETNTIWSPDSHPPTPLPLFWMPATTTTGCLW